MGENTSTTSPAILACQEMYNCMRVHAQMTDIVIDVFFVSTEMFEAIINTPAIKTGDIEVIANRRALKNIQLNPDDDNILVTLIENNCDIPTARALEWQWIVGEGIDIS